MSKWSCALFLFLTFTSMLYCHSPLHAGAEEILISVLKGMEEEDPVIAWDGKHYMVVWQTNRKSFDDYNVYGGRVSPEGKLLDPLGFAISTAPSNQIFLDVAWGNDGYLAVWQDLRSRQRWEINGARFRPDGKVLDPQGIPIATGKRNARHPQVAWDGENFLVVWMEEHEGRGWDVAAVRLSPQGKIVDQERLLITEAPGDQAHPAVAWGDGHYLVVWMDHPPNASQRISGTRLSAAGKVLDPQGFVLSRSSNNPGFPAVAWGKEHFVVVWADQPPATSYTLWGVRVSGSGELIDREDFVIERGATLQTLPSVRCVGDECLVVWEKEQSQKPMQGIEDVIRDVKGAWIDLAQPTVTPQVVMIAPKAVGNHFAKVASDGRRYLVVWKDYRSGTAASLGRFVTPPR